MALTIGEVLKQTENDEYLEYVKNCISLILSEFETISYKVSERSVLPYETIFQFKTPNRFKIESSDDLMFCLITLLQQIERQITTNSFRFQRVLGVRNCQANFFENISNLKSSGIYFNEKSIPLFLTLLKNVSRISIPDDSQIKNVSLVIVSEFQKKSVEVFWEIVETMSVETLKAFVTTFIDFSYTLQSDEKTLLDVFVGILIMEVPKELKQLLYPLEDDFLIVQALKRLENFSLFSCVVPPNDKVRESPMIDNPSLSRPRSATKTIGSIVKYQYICTEITSTFQILSDFLERNGVKEFVKKCGASGLKESYTYDLLLRILRFDPSDVSYLQSCADTLVLANPDVHLRQSGDIFVIEINNKIAPQISFDFFNPLMLLLTQKHQQNLFEMYVTLCRANDFPLFCGKGVDGWKVEVLLNQEILINMCALATKTPSLITLIITFLWLRVKSKRVVPPHPINKRVVLFLRSFSNTSTVCAKTVWRLLAEYQYIDETLTTEFYKTAK
ncbi:hypothetical protein EIN_497340 [Entamoeba invadens IP1]|uniref:Uncharacterized protein n=1 Tax=Entamoeba invadens IP1 TaxID=370355 RepID=A0A0A1UDR9_ENTIV|nr:hypothetical protein EIN_497340 [Entamoeba invadens IP1]ELP94584.1 hypothetical protein EIN_497340 [Entamoeba invadens IP1]|eukprot:XP_004261355.1 hypothetical protein EIN_497340 [Entamoeba invadens IP1]